MTTKPDIMIAGGGIAGLTLRRPATAAVVAANRSRAHDEILDLVDASAGEIEAIMSKYRQTAQFDKNQLQ